MSRIGKKPIQIPEGVEVELNGTTVTVKGKNGELTRDLSPAITIVIEDNEMTFTRENDQKANREIHGTTRSIVANMIEGVSTGFAKKLEIVGVGYRLSLIHI